MNLRDCLNDAVRGGGLSRDEADDLMKRYASHQKALAGLGETVADQRAKALLETELRAEGALKQRRALLQTKVAGTIVSNLENFRNGAGKPDVLEAVLAHLEHYGFAGFPSVEGRMKALTGEAVGEMERILYETRRTYGTGQYRARAAIDGVVDAAFGAPNASEQSRAFYAAFAGVAEKHRQLFNAAGGNIAKLENWGLPQHHDASALVRAGREKWVAFTRERLDLEKMRDPLTGGPLTRERLDGILPHIWDSIVTDGWNTRTPSMQAQGRGMLAGQRADHRFLAFAGPDAWRDYQANFGSPDVFAAMMGHVRSMTRDIAAMEILGPNPAGTLNWMKQIVEQERGKAVTGRESLFNGSSLSAFDRKNVADYQIDGLWTEIRGNGGPLNSNIANAVSGVRNIITAARLDRAAITAAFGDPATMIFARGLAGMPMLQGVVSGVAAQFGREGKREALRAGLNIEAAMHVIKQEARFAGSVGGPEWTRWLPDRVLHWTGLTPLTTAERTAFGLDLMGHMADQTALPHADLPARTQTMLTGFGLDAAHWDALRSAPLHEPVPGASYLRPKEILDGAEGLRREAGLRYLEMVHGMTELAIPSGTKRGKALLMAGTKEGSLLGELVRSMAMFKSFTASYMLNWGGVLRRELNEQGAVRGGANAGAMVITMTALGGVGYQLKQIASGKDAMDPKDPKFWAAAAASSGGLGLYSDFMFADHTRFGHSLGETIAGPGVQFVGDVARLGQKMARGPFDDKAKPASEAVKFMGNYMPGGDMWMIGPAFQRVIMDQMQYLANPDQHRSFRSRERNLARETGQGYWWPPGTLFPERAPAIAEKR